MKGELTIVQRDSNGSIKHVLNVPNLVVTAGKQYIASRMVGTSTNVMSHMAIGTGTATPAVGDTVLGTEAGRVSLASFSATGATVTATATFPAGTMLCRTTFPVVNTAAGDSIAITWVITVS